MREMKWQCMERAVGIFRQVSMPFHCVLARYLGVAVSSTFQSKTQIEESISSAPKMQLSSAGKRYAAYQELTLWKRKPSNKAVICECFTTESKTADEKSGVSHGEAAPQAAKRRQACRGWIFTAL